MATQQQATRFQVAGAALTREAGTSIRVKSRVGFFMQASGSDEGSAARKSSFEMGGRSRTIFVPASYFPVMEPLDTLSVRCAIWHQSHRPCNFRCVYCMPRRSSQDLQSSPRGDLSFEEIERLVRASLASAKSTAHGREPLSAATRAPRRDAAKVSDLDLTLPPRRPSRVEGARAARRGPEARDRQPRLAGRRGVQEHERRRLPGREGPRGMDAAEAVGLAPSSHMVVKRGLNEQSICRWRATSAAPGGSSVHRIHGRRLLERLAVNDVCRRARSWATIDRELPLEPVDRTTP